MKSVRTCRPCRAVAPLAALVLVCCSPGGGSSSSAASANAPEFCARRADDRVHRAFCSAAPPQVGGLADLASAIGVGGEGESAVFLAHSTALFGRLVSPINPRIIRIDGDQTFLAFQRGVQAVEIVSGQPRNFYLVTFEQACNGQSAGCLPGDLYTPRLESNWTEVQIRDAEDLKNTPFDCRQCHQRGLTSPILLMREFDNPWTHFFIESNMETSTYARPEVQGFDLFDDFVRAKGNESYGGVRADVPTDALTLQWSVTDPQPLIFDGTKIAEERWPLQPDGEYASTPQPSPTWYAAYDAFKRGEELALPYFAPRPTDPAKQAALTAAYAQYRSGLTAPEGLPDLSDIYPDDPQVRAEIGLETEPAATPAQALVQACGSCHNDVLDQSISRARFNIALSRMSRAEIDVAIGRLTEPSTSPTTMPPAVTRQLDPNGRQALIDYLRQNTRSNADDVLLDHAAELGMGRVTASAVEQRVLGHASGPATLTRGP